MTPTLDTFVKGILWPDFSGCPFPRYVAFLRSEYYGGSERLGPATRSVSRILAC
jgi:hypothetical protein